MPGRPASGGPPNPSRRRLLVAGGFAAASWALLRELPDNGVAPSAPIQTQTVDAGPPALAEAPPAPGAGHVFDLVIEGGRVMDPESGFDSVAFVGIDGSSVTGLSTEPLEGRASIDADGLVVAPGFIDILSYEPNDYGIWYKIADGVTTNLGMHGINATADAFFPTFAGTSPAHYGGGFDNPYARALLDIGGGEAATQRQLAQLEQQLREGIAGGWIGLDLEPEYTPGIEREEIDRLSRIATELGVPVFFHGRYSDPIEPGTNEETIEEILDVARTTGAAVHVEHITSTGGTFTMDRTIEQLDAARAEGIDVTACLYPYDFWATFLLAARWDDDAGGATFQERFRIEYEDLQIAGTDERLDEVTFQTLRDEGENPIVAAIGSIPEADIERALQAPYVMLGSDGILEPGDNNHPRAAGTFARLFGRYVRERETLGLMDALAKATILPAQRVESGAPAMRRKGRLQRGADADITIFDPERIEDRATVKEPAQMSRGIEWVLVDGTVVKTPEMTEEGDFDRSRRPGQPITGQA